MSRLKKRGGTWFADFTVNGKRVVKTTGIKVGDDPKASRATAQVQADTMERMACGSISLGSAMEALRAMARATGMIASAPSIKDYLTNGYKPRGGESNVSGYHRSVGVLLDFLGDLANRPLDQLTVGECTEFLTKQLQVSAYGSVRLQKSMLSTAFNAAVADDIILKNPWSFVRIDHIAPRNMPRKMKRLPFTEDEMRIMFTQFASPWRELVAVSFLTGGQRISDVCRLKWSHVDFNANIIDFSTKKTSKEIKCPIIAPLRAILENLRTADDEYVFPEMYIMYSTRRGSASTQFVKMLRDNGIDPMTIKTPGSKRAFSRKSFHSIRHTVVSMLRLSNQFSQDLTRQIVGHDSEDVEREYSTADMPSKQAGIEYLFSQVQKAPTAFLP